MAVSKTLKLKLLEQTKKSQGNIQIKKGGLLRWETEEPNHSLVLADGKVLWLVDYVAGEDEKPNIVKAPDPKKSQPHAVVAFLFGEGRISDDFSVTKEKKSDDHHTTLELKPKKDADQIKWLNLSVDKDKNEIETISFEDAVGNVTELTFKEIQFNSDIDSKVFKFVPPKGADITVLR
jgi:outer membrane lipoprotein carrier protein